MKTAARSWFLNAFRRNSRRVLQRKLKGFDQSVFESEDFSKHFAHVETSEPASRNVIKGFVIDRINFINSALGAAAKNDTFADLGDSSGIFIKALRKKGTSINISPDVVKNIRAKGLKVICADVENLNLKAGSFDHILFFEIFEHVPNPIHTLKLLHKLCKKSVILSVPHMSKTNIHRYHYDRTQRDYENHIFEFSDGDFRKMLTHAGFHVARHKVVKVVDKTGATPSEKLAFRVYRILKKWSNDVEYNANAEDIFCGCFKRFSIYHLVKKRATEISLK